MRSLPARILGGRQGELLGADAGRVQPSAPGTARPVSSAAGAPVNTAPARGLEAARAAAAAFGERRPRRRSRKAAQALGARLERLAAEYFKAQGARVEVAPMAVAWIPVDKDNPKSERKPISVRRDYFGVWDLMVVWSATRRTFAQVTVAPHVGDKRAKVLAAGFPAGGEDLILGWEGGRVFRVLRGPGFEPSPERIMAPAPPKRPRPGRRPHEQLEPDYPR